MVEVDKQFFDLFTAIDNLLKENQVLQTKTNSLLEANNFLLEELLSKPTILEAPQLTQISIERKQIEVPPNVVIVPKLYFDADRLRYYRLSEQINFTNQFFVEPTTVAGPKSFIGPVDISVLGDVLGVQFDLLQFAAYKFEVPSGATSDQLFDGDGQVPPPPTTPPNYEAVSFAQVFKNGKLIIGQSLLPLADFIFPDPSDINFVFEPKDTIEIIIDNGNTIGNPDITVYFSVLFSLWREINESSFKTILDRIQNLFTI